MVKALPSLGGFLQHSQVWNGPTFDPVANTSSIPPPLWGLQLNVPIFSSGSRIQKAKQTKIAIEQAKVNQTATEQRLIAMAEQSRSQARTAMDNLLTEEKSMELSKKIMDRTTIKFNTGSASSFEYTQEQGNYLMAQQMYIQRMVELLMARISGKSLDSIESTDQLRAHVLSRHRCEKHYAEQLITAIEFPTTQ
ncbi:MAG: TolC family protein [Flavobacteriales bacterium]|nr:TolC family protein [Flavobacteriales bacterium]